MSHEFLPKNKQFTIYHAGMGTFTKEQIDNCNPLINLFADNLTNELNDDKVNCGVVVANQKGKKVSQIFVPKLAADFRRAVRRFVREIESDTSIHSNFFETAAQINMENFNK